MRWSRACSSPSRPRDYTSLVRSFATRVADLEEPDLAHVDAREGVADERVEPRLVYLHVEDASTPGGHRDGLDVALRVGGVRQVTVHVRAVEDRPDDVEIGVEARPRGHYPEPDDLARIGLERVRRVLAGIAVPGHPVGQHQACLLHVQLRGALDPRLVEVPLARDE